MQPMEGDFQVVHVIDEGATGTVCLARDVQGNRWVTLNRLPPDFAGDAGRLECIRADVGTMMDLAHPGIVQVYGMGADAEGPYIVTEYVAGPDSADRDDWPSTLPHPPLNLESCVREQVPFDAMQVAQVGRQLCCALAYAHERGVVHRDVKPANVLLNEKGEPKLTGFKLNSLADDDQGMGAAGALLLTLAYLAPEQEIDPSRADPRTDIYALAGTLWFLLTGRDARYFSAADVPQPLREVLVKAMQKGRDKRFRTAGEFEQALANLDFVSAAPSLPAEPPADSRDWTIRPSEASLRGQQSSASARASAADFSAESSGSEHTIRKSIDSFGSATGSAAWSNRASALFPPAELTPGRCPACGYQHVLDPNRIFKQKHCGGCGGPMLEPCLKCGEENGVWAKFCGPCGADLAAEVQRVVKEFQANQERIDGLRTASQFADARACLVQMANASHPRLSKYAVWAKDALAQVDAELEAATQRRDASVQQAESLLLLYDYAAAVSVLQEIPESLRTPKSAGLLRQARAALAEIDTLRDELRSGVAGNQFKDLKPKAVRLRELQPNDSVAREVFQQFKAWEDQRDASIEQAEQLMAMHDFAAAVPALRGIVEAVRTSQSASRLMEAEAAVGKITRLREAMRRSAAAQQFKDLKPTVAQLLDLQPNDGEAKRVLQQIAAWEQQRDASVRQAEALMAAHDFAAAIKVLQGIPEAATTAESARLLLQAQTAANELNALWSEIRTGVAAKQYEGLEPKVARALELQPNNAQAQNLLQQLKTWQLRQHERMWDAISKSQTVEDYRKYLQTCPDGPHAAEARRALPLLLRKKLLASPSDWTLRNEYLDQRTPDLAETDAEMALRASRIAYAVAAGIAGSLAGAFLGGIALLGGLPAGAVAGIAVAVFLDRPGFKERRPRAGTSQVSDNSRLGFGIGGLVAAGIGLCMLFWLLGHYGYVASGIEAFFGFLLGAFAGAGCGALVPQFGGRYRIKAELGPLKWQDCLSSIAGLYAKCRRPLTDVGLMRENPWIRPAITAALICGLLFAAFLMTANSYHPPPAAPHTETHQKNTTHPSQVSGPVRFDGMYRDWGDNSAALTKGFRDHRQYHAYLRFFADGTVLYTLSHDAPNHVFTFLNTNYARSQGQYSLNDKGDRISFSIRTGNQTVDYQGTVGPEILRLHRHDHADGRESDIEFRYVRANP